MRNYPALCDSIAYCVKVGIPIPIELLQYIAAKTTGSFQANMWAAVQHLYSNPNHFGQMEFEVIIKEILTVELTQAWQDGMRSLEYLASRACLFLSSMER